MLLTIAGLVALFASGALALFVAIQHNGAAVLNRFDRITGGSRGAQLLASVSTGDHPEQQVIVWGPRKGIKDTTARPVLVFVHGGSWASGSPVDYGFVGRAFVLKGFVVVLVGYRLGPDGKYPGMIEDTARAIGWTQREIAQFGGDPARITVAGHSAGAYNVMMTALEEKWLAAEGVSLSDISGVIGLSGPYEIYPYTSDASKAAFGHAADPPSTQPISHIRGDAPPLLLIHGEQDKLVRPKNTPMLAEMIEAAGGQARAHLYPEMAHRQPLIALASPWRQRRDIDDKIADFARSLSVSDTASVPVQGETR